MIDTIQEISNENQVKSKKRVEDHGEVFTSEREVNAMLDLVIHETERIDSKFLEPACGTGNFLVEILKRKLAVVERKYKERQLQYEQYAVIAVSSIYGIDILQDNVNECRERLFQIIDNQYNTLYNSTCKANFKKTVRFVLNRNILWGDALNLKTPDEKAEAIVFSEWSAVDFDVKRRDFMLAFLLNKGHQMEMFSDENKPTYIPEPVKEYPLTHFLRLADEIDYQL
jgi:hypothetical protein